MVEQGGGPTQGVPTAMSWNFTDELGGLSYAHAITMALYARDRPGGTGLGQRVDTSQLGATISFQGPHLFKALLGEKQRDDGEGPIRRIRELVYVGECKDGKNVAFMPMDPMMWE